MMAPGIRTAGLRFSEDGTTAWEGPIEAACDTHVTPAWANHTRSRSGATPLSRSGLREEHNLTLSSRQRPFLFHDHDDAFYLYTGVGLPGKSHWNFSCTFVQQLDTGPASHQE